jgi:predicted AlkP superfamily pyrophosphatase or phosphodiesterase
MDENCKKITFFYYNSSGKQQALGSLRITNYLLGLMKETDVYDQSLIIVMADHGIKRTAEDFNSVVFQDPSLALRPIFLLKRKHAHQTLMAYNDNPIHITDTTPTILSELGILQGEDAFSPFEMPESLMKERNSQWESIWSSAK